MIRYYIAISVTLSQIWNSPVNIQYCKPSDWLDIVSQHQNENSSSIDIENIAAANNRYTNTQEQPLSVTPIPDYIGANWSFSDRFNIPPCPNDTAILSIDINNITVSRSQNGIIKNQNQSLSVPLAQQSVNGTQQSLSGSLAQQHFNEIQGRYRLK